MQEELIPALLASILRNEAATEPRSADWPSFIAAAERHGVLALVADALPQAWSPQLRAAMRPRVLAQAAVAIVREREASRVVALLDAAGVAALIVKGAHLACTHYGSPHHRPYVDVDLLIEEESRLAAGRCLLAAGYAPAHQIDREVAFGQRQYERVDEGGAVHTVDLHWRVANPLAFADRLTFGDLAAAAVRVPRLGPHARAPSPAHALLLACLHRTAHHGTSHRLIWLYDIHLVAATLSDPDWLALVRAAIAGGLAPVLSAGLDDVAEVFHTCVPAEITRTLGAHAAGDPDMLGFLAGPRTTLEVAASDWRHVSGWRNRGRFLREHLFPSRAYIEQRYGVVSNVALPFLYAHRIVSGARGWLERRQR
jgi:Uncharacterised nucleotidyltransferase